MNIVLFLAFSYLIGSVPFALIIGKVFFRTDIREKGSGNLGGGNAGRVLGKGAGVAVMTLDILKVSLVVFLGERFFGSDTVIALAALAAAIGHCFPVFARFRGGKAVATMYGFLFGLFVACGFSPLVFFGPLVIFLAVLYFTKIIALSSIISAAAVSAYIGFAGGSLPFALAAAAFTLLIIIRHKKNIERIREHTENKVSWL